VTIDVRTAFASRVAQGEGRISIRTIADGLRLNFPIAVRDMVGLLEPIRISFQLNSGTCSGSGEINISNDGLCHYTGTVHDSGALAVKYTTITYLHAVLPPRYQELVFRHIGHVGGTLSFDTRHDTWDESSVWAPITDNWALVKAAAAPTTAFGTDAGATELLDAFANAATGFWVFGT
jgi:hypothetical protein